MVAMAKQWFFQLMGAEMGPVSSAELKRRAEQGQIQPDTLIRNGKNAQWHTAVRVKGLFCESQPKSDTAEPDSEEQGLDADLLFGIEPEDYLFGAELDEASASDPIQPAPEPQPDPEAQPPLHKPQFFDMWECKQAIPRELNEALQEYMEKHGLSAAQVNRQALAEFVGRPELGED